MENIVGLKELRTHPEKIAAKTARGESFIVVRRSKPLFEINPLRRPRKPVNLEDWKKFAGILKGKKIEDPVKWQRRIRKEWERDFSHLMK